MFNSVKEWINVPFKYKPFIKYTGTGTILYGEEVESLCYPVGDVKRVMSYDGTEITSTNTLYLDGTHPIKYTDTIIFEGFERRILRIGTYYRDGKPDLKVVYL